MSSNFEIIPEMKQFYSVHDVQYMYQKERQSPVRVEGHDACTNTKHKDNIIDVSDKIIE